MHEANRKRLMDRLSTEAEALRASARVLDDRVAGHRAILAGYTSEDPCDDPDPWKQYLNGCEP